MVRRPRDRGDREHHVRANRADDASDDLRRHVGPGVTPGDAPERRVHEGHDRIEVRTRERTEDEDEDEEPGAGHQRVLEQLKSDVARRQLLGRDSRTDDDRRQERAAQEFSEEQYRLWLEGNIKKVSLFSIPSGTMGTLSSEVSMAFGLRGMSHVVTTGCTSSTDAIGYAYRQIQSGLPGIPKAIIAGGVDSPLAHGIMKGFTLMKILTTRFNDDPQRASRPFSADRDGFVIAEGAWMFVLEDREHARARGANILAEITGYGSTCEAFHRVRLAECGEEPARAIQLALEESGITSTDVDYVNLHGTSTQLNDRIETRALKLALGNHASKTPMSALKSQIGHPQGASGAAGLAATIVAMKHGQVPPTINLENPDPECDLDYVPEPGRKVKIENAVCNCIAFGSKNSALAVRKIE